LFNQSHKKKYLLGGGKRDRDGKHAVFNFRKKQKQARRGRREGVRLTSCNPEEDAVGKIDP